MEPEQAVRAPNKIPGEKIHFLDLVHTCLLRALNDTLATDTAESLETKSFFYLKSKNRKKTEEECLKKKEDLKCFCSATQTA